MIFKWFAIRNLNEIYKCEICGKIVEVIHLGGGELVCCGLPMNLLTANTVDASKEKHVPVVEKTDKSVKIKVGAQPHPMEGGHYIEWIEIIFDGKVDRQYLKPGEEPVAEFNVLPGQLIARAYCNLHGLWQTQN